MPFHLLTAVLPLTTACATAVLLLQAWQHREVNGTRAFAMFLGAVLIWCFFSALEQISPSAQLQIIFGKIAYFGIAPLPVLWLIFTLKYTQRDDWLQWPIVGGFSIIPLLTLIFALTDRWHGLMWKAAEFQLEPFPKLIITHGWWFNWVMIPSFYMIYMLSYCVLLVASFSAPKLHRKQTLMLVCAGMCPLIFNMLYVIAKIQLYGLDVTPIGFGFSGVFIYFNLFGAKFLDIAPISYKTVFLNTTDAVILLDIQRRIVDLNPAALRETPQRTDISTAIGQLFGRVFPDYHQLMEQLDSSQADELTETIGLSRLPANSRRGQVQEDFSEVKVRLLRSPGGNSIGWVIIVRDVTLEKQQQAQLEKFAYADSLTGLFNRRQLELKAKEAFSFQSKPGDNSPDSIALLYVDLNQFKPINDSYGHDVGDAVLRYFARCLQRSVREGDMVVRLGGDEFAALLYGADEKMTWEVRDRLSALLEQDTVLMGHQLALSASIGAAYYPTDGTTLPMLLRQADKNMYQEKQQKKQQRKESKKTALGNCHE